MSREEREEHIRAEETQQMVGLTLHPRALVYSPQHIWDFDDSYMRESMDEFIMRLPDNTREIEVVNYLTSWKAVEEQRKINYYAYP